MTDYVPRPVFPFERRIDVPEALVAIAEELRLANCIAALQTAVPLATGTRTALHAALFEPKPADPERCPMCGSIDDEPHSERCPVYDLAGQ